MLEDKSKKVPEGVEEIDEEELDLVAGGVSREVWDSYTVEQKQQARLQSILALRKGEACTTVITEE